MYTPLLYFVLLAAGKYKLLSHSLKKLQQHNPFSRILSSYKQDHVRKQYFKGS